MGLDQGPVMLSWLGELMPLFWLMDQDLISLKGISGSSSRSMGSVCLWAVLLALAEVSSVQFSHSVVSDSLWPHESQHTRPPCPSQTPGVYSNSCPSSLWCHPAISSSVVPFYSCPQSLLGSGSFPMSQLFSWGGQSIGVSASASVLPGLMNTQDLSPFCSHFKVAVSAYLQCCPPPTCPWGHCPCFCPHVPPYTAGWNLLGRGLSGSFLVPSALWRLEGASLSITGFVCTCFFSPPTFCLRAYMFFFPLCLKGCMHCPSLYASLLTSPWPHPLHSEGCVQTVGWMLCHTQLPGPTFCAASAVCIGWPALCALRVVCSV